MPDANSRDLTTRRWRALEEVVARFEQAWRDGAGPPAIADFLPDGPDRPAVLRELAHVDLELRLAAGLEARAADYLAAFPELAADSAARSLADAEARLRPGPAPAAGAGSPHDTAPTQDTGTGPWQDRSGQ